MDITKEFYGRTPDGMEVDLYILTNANGMKVEIINYGAKIVSIFAHDREGKLADVVLGYGSLEGYLKPNFYFGALVGRCANRIENARFNLDGVEYRLSKNRGEHHLHGGFNGFDKHVWRAEAENEENRVILHHFSHDGEEGYPGNLEVTVIYTLTCDNELVIQYLASGDKDTPVNLTNHSYFNLSGHSSGDILGHEIMISSSAYTAIDSGTIPTGEIKDVKTTPFDFREMTAVGKRISEDCEELIWCGGYDINYVLDNNDGKLEKAAEVYDPLSGRVMEVFTTMPGMQFYTANYVDGSKIGKGGCAYQKHSGLCLETQYFPNAVNRPEFASPVLKAGKQYDHTTVYKFSSKI